MVALVVCVVLLPLLFISSDGDAQSSHTVLLGVIDAIERLIGFYKASYNDLNLDGFFGLKVVEGQIQRTLQEHEQGQHTRLSPTVVQRLQTLLKDIRWVGERAIAAVRADDESYFNKLSYVIAQPWSLFKQPRKVVPSLRWGVPIYKASENKRLDEQQSDKCMIEITKPAKSQSRCSLSRECGLIMTRRGLTDYGITHQLLWTALAERAGCGEQMNDLMKTLGFNSTDDMQEEFCTNNYYEMLTSVHIFMSGKVSGDFQDMFMEQQFVCPSLGFFEFLKKDYLDQILSWQLPSGCFGENPDTDPPVQNHILDDFPPERDDRETRLVGKLNNLSKINSLDMRKKEVQEQLKILQSSNVLHQKKDKDDALARLQERLQKLSGNPVVHNQAILQRHSPGGERLVGNPGQPIQQQQNPQSQQNPGGNAYQQGYQSMNENRPPQAQSNVLVNGVNKLQDRFPSHFQKEKINNPPGAAYRLPERIPIKQEDSLHNNPQRRTSYESKGNFPNLLEENFPRKYPVQVPFRDQGVVGHGNVLGHQNIDLNDVANRQPEALRYQRRNPDLDSVKAQAQVVRVGAEGQRQPLPPVLDPTFRGLPRQRVLNAYESGQGSRRKLLVEKDMPGGCLSHKTGVACGALALYLSYLINPPPVSSFYSDTHVGMLVDKEPYGNVLEFLGKKLAKENLDDGGEEEEYEKEEEEEEEDDDGEDGRDREEEEMYPDARHLARLQEKKVVHFGANGNTGPGSPDEENNDMREDRKDMYKDEKDEEEEGPDYIKRIEDDTKPANTKNADDTEYTYYEDSDNFRGGVKKHKGQPQPQTHTRADTHDIPAAQEPSIVVNGPTLGQKDSPPAKMLVVLLSAVSLALIFLVCKFMRKRRIHLKYGSRAFLRL